MVFNEITYFPILGLPLFYYLGAIAFILMIAAATVAYVTMKGIKIIPVKYHIWLARLAILFALVHGMLMILSLF
jgi:uncharacterized membrane protein